jgi:hypothetical protein
MAFQLSPGVNVSEVDLTTIVPAVGTTEGAFAGNFVWGPANQIITVSNEVELVNIFGRPDSNTFASFFSAANFLAYARNLKVVRAVANTAKNATAAGSGVLIENQDIYVDQFYPQTNTVYGIAAARYPGDLGNSLKVSIYTGANTDVSSWVYGDRFNGAPGTSVYAAGVNGANDEMHIVVVDEDGKFSGTANTILEKFGYVSAAVDAKTDDGSSNYYVNVINDRSKYVYMMTKPANTTNWGAAASGTTFSANNVYEASLTNGVSASPSNADIIVAYDKFANAEEVDISLIVTGDADPTVSKHIVDNIAESRRDCVVFISPERADVVNNDGSESADVVALRKTFNPSSYAFMDSGWKYQFDKYNNVYRWVPLNGDIAGLCVRTDFERDPWFSPAGFNRGSIKNVVKLSWNPNQADRDNLYKNGINPVVSFPGQGVVLYGDKTMLDKPSAFDRVNVRRLFIVLEKAIARASRYSLFEFNDEFTRAQFVALVEPFLRDVQGRRGIFDFRVVCDETNNTPEIIDRNEFVGDIYIKPARSINFIQLNFVAVRTGVSFDEIVGRAQ